jgi:uncharacterized protein (TIGR04222 family)
MDWTAPYLLVALGCYAALELWFVAMMIATGHRYRVVSPRLAAAGPVSKLPTLSYEELGLLAHDERRWVEVALLRLCLEGHVKEDGLIVLVNDPGENSVQSEGRTAREAILDRLRRGRPVHLMDVLEAGRRRGDSAGARRRLAELGLIDEHVVRIARTRDRVFDSYVYLLTLILATVTVCLAAASAGSATGLAAAVTVAVFLLAILVTTLAFRLTGGQFRPSTPVGRELLTRAEREVPRPADERLLHRVALHGLTTVPEFEQAAHHGEPDAGLGTKQKAFSVFAEVFSTVATSLGGGGSGQRK